LRRVLSAYENQVITTRSNPSAFPSALRQKKTSLVQQRDVEKKKVYVDEDCEKCGNKQMSVKTMQLRSADEGGKPPSHSSAIEPAFIKHSQMLID
jgi:DNA-directed RNA polymerase I subunit RPA12